MEHRLLQVDYFSNTELAENVDDLLTNVNFGYDIFHALSRCPIIM